VDVPITEGVGAGVGAHNFSPTGRVSAGRAVVVIAVGVVCASCKAWLSALTSGQERIAQVGQWHLPVALY
jgi:hypothetical protein